MYDFIQLTFWDEKNNKEGTFNLYHILARDKIYISVLIIYDKGQ